MTRRRKQSNLFVVRERPAVWRAVIYCRVSTDDQAQHGTSLGSQEQVTTAFVASKGWELVNRYIEEGVSGGDDPWTRPQMSRLLAAASAGEFDVLVVSRGDRFDRELRHQLNLRHELESVGVDVVYAESPHASRLEANLTSVVAEEEKRKIIQNTMNGTCSIVQMGYWAGGTPPFGFKVEPENRRMRLAIDEDEAQTVRFIYECFVEKQMSTQDTATRLNSRGIRPRKAKRWNSLLIRRMMLKSAWDGRWVYAKDDTDFGRSSRSKGMALRQEVSIPAILSDEQQALMDDRLQRTSMVRRNGEQVYPLSFGRLISPCGHNYSGLMRKERGKRIYRCWFNRAELGDDERCDCQHLNAKLVETWVLQKCIGVLSNPELLLKRTEQFIDLRDAQGEIEAETIADINRQIKQRKKQLDEMVVELTKLGMVAQIGPASETLRAEIEDAESRKKQLEFFQKETTAATDRMKRITDLGKQLAEQSGNFSLEDIDRIFETFGIVVTVKGFVDCSHCKNGRVSAPSPFVADENTVRSATMKDLTAEFADLSRSWLQALARNNKIPSTQLANGVRLFNVDEVRAAITARELDTSCAHCAGMGSLPQLSLAGVVEPTVATDKVLPFRIDETVSSVG